MNQAKIGKFLAELRKENGMTQEQLAEKLNVARRTISRWETGNNMLAIAIAEIRPAVFLFIISTSLFTLISGFQISDRRSTVITLPFISLSFTAPKYRLSFAFSR